MNITKLLSATQTYYNLNSLEKKLNQFSQQLNHTHEKAQVHNLCELISKEYDSFKVSPLYPFIRDNIKARDKNIKKMHLLGLDNQLVNQDEIFEQLNRIDFLMNHLLIFSNSKKFSFITEHLSVVHLLKDYLETPDIKPLFSKYQLDESLIYSNMLLNHSLMYLKNNHEPYNDVFMAPNYEFNLLKESTEIFKKNKNNAEILKHDLVVSFILDGYIEDKSFKDIFDNIKPIYENRTYYSKIFNSQKNELIENEETRELFQKHIMNNIEIKTYFSSLGNNFKNYVNEFVEYVNHEIVSNHKHKKAIQQFDVKTNEMPSLLERIRFIKEKKQNKALATNMSVNNNSNKSINKTTESKSTLNFIEPKLNIKYQ
jgi:hypothetical protein